MGDVVINGTQDPDGLHPGSKSLEWASFAQTLKFPAAFVGLVKRGWEVDVTDAKIIWAWAKKLKEEAEEAMDSDAGQASGLEGETEIVATLIRERRGFRKKKRKRLWTVIRSIWGTLRDSNWNSNRKGSARKTKWRVKRSQEGRTIKKVKSDR